MLNHDLPFHAAHNLPEPWPCGPLMVDIQRTPAKPVSRRRRALGFWLDFGASLAIVGMCAAFGLTSALP